ncbi:hypothetical protein Acr_13g0001740 [Actinidia rufa]|uniref:Uncharacterized protein n=1 Tax=Actinidia rufa TaxID=165716 RepID=A0A7J0FJM3_9ERIC|nr:hypothetical protein Acr_13g0001740 [Actinidia rufa]
MIIISSHHIHAYPHGNHNATAAVASEYSSGHTPPASPLCSSGDCVRLADSVGPAEEGKRGKSPRRRLLNPNPRCIVVAVYDGFLVVESAVGISAYIILKLSCWHIIFTLMGIRFIWAETISLFALQVIAIFSYFSCSWSHLFGYLQLGSHRTRSLPSSFSESCPG